MYGAIKVYMEKQRKKETRKTSIRTHLYPLMNISLDEDILHTTDTFLCNFFYSENTWQNLQKQKKKANHCTKLSVCIHMSLNMHVQRRLWTCICLKYTHTHTCIRNTYTGTYTNIHTQAHTHTHASTHIH